MNVNTDIIIRKTWEYIIINYLQQLICVAANEMFCTLIKTVNMKNCVLFSMTVCKLKLKEPYSLFCWENFICVDKRMRELSIDKK